MAAADRGDVPAVPLSEARSPRQPLPPRIQDPRRAVTTPTESPFLLAAPPFLPRQPHTRDDRVLVHVQCSDALDQRIHRLPLARTDGTRRPREALLRKSLCYVLAAT